MQFKSGTCSVSVCCRSDLLLPLAQVAFVSFLVQLGDVCREACLHPDWLNSWFTWLVGNNLRVPPLSSYQCFCSSAVVSEYFNVFYQHYAFHALKVFGEKNSSLHQALFRVECVCAACLLASVEDGVDLLWIRSQRPAEPYRVGSRLSFADGRVRSRQKWRLVSILGSADVLVLDLDLGSFCNKRAFMVDAGSISSELFWYFLLWGGVGSAVQQLRRAQMRDRKCMKVRISCFKDAYTHTKKPGPTYKRAYPRTHTHMHTCAYILF